MFQPAPSLNYHRLGACMRRHRLCIACIATTTRHEVGVEFYGSLPGLLFQWPDVCTRVGISETLGGLMICQGDGYPYSRTASMQPLFCQHPRCSGDHGKTTASCRAAFCCWVTQCSQNISTPGERRQLHSHSVRSLHSALCTLHSALCRGRPCRMLCVERIFSRCSQPETEDEPVFHFFR